jgi:hypothetical protein
VVEGVKEPVEVVAKRAGSAFLSWPALVELQDTLRAGIGGAWESEYLPMNWARAEFV